MATRVAYLETEAIIPGRESWASVSIGSSRSTKCHQVLTVLTMSRAAAQRVAAQRAATHASCGFAASYRPLVALGRGRIDAGGIVKIDQC